MIPGNNLTDLAAFLRILAMNFRAFFERAFAETEPDVVLVDGDFIALMIDWLEQVLHGSSHRIVVNLPPRHLKSLMISIAFVAFVLGQDPRKKIAVISHTQSLARDLAMKTKRVMESAWYREVFPKTRLKQDTLTELVTSEGGFRYAASFDTGITGRGFDIIIIDDPISAHNANSGVERRKNVETFHTMIESRLNHPELGSIIVVQQRLHDDDLSGVLLRKGGWKHLALPLIAETQEVHHIGSRVWTRRPGDVLVPERWSDEVVTAVRKSVGEAVFATQYQQNPSASFGDLIKDDNLRRFQLIDLPADARRNLTISIDTALKKDDDASYGVALVMATDGRHHYVIDVLRGRFDFPELRDAVLRLLGQYQITNILIEEATVGPALASTLREHGHASILCPTRGRSKLERFQEQLHLFVDGRVWVACDQAWVVTLINELLRFPHDRHDDQVDALTQYLAWTSSNARTHPPVVMGTSSTEARLVRAMGGAPPPRGVHPMRNPGLRARRRWRRLTPGR